MDIEQMRLRMGEMAAEIERLQSIVDEANAQEPVDYERLLNGEWVKCSKTRYEVTGDPVRALYASPIPAQQSPAVAVPDGRFSAEFNQFYADSMGCYMPPAHKVDCYTSWIAALQSPRITEQYAREILVNYFSVGGMLTKLNEPRAKSIENWISGEGRALLDKISGASNEKAN